MKKPPAGIKTLDSFRSVLRSPRNPGKKASEKTSDLCPVCSRKLEKMKYAWDYIVRGCSHCGKTFYYDSDNKRFIELAVGYSDFFGTTLQQG